MPGTRPGQDAGECCGSDRRREAIVSDRRSDVIPSVASIGSRGTSTDHRSGDCSRPWLAQMTDVVHEIRSKTTSTEALGGGVGRRSRTGTSACDAATQRVPDASDGRSHLVSTSESSSEHPNLEVVVHEVVGGTRCISASGELDHDSCPVLDRAFADPGPAGSHAELDLSGVTFIDSAGIRCVVRGIRHLLAHGVSFQLVAASVHAERTLVMTGLHDTLRRGLP